MAVAFKFAAVLCAALLAGRLGPGVIAAIARRCGLEPVEWRADTGRFLYLLFTAFFVLLCLLTGEIWRTVYVAAIYILGWVAGILDVKYRRVPGCAALAVGLVGAAFALTLLRLAPVSMLSGCAAAGAVFLPSLPWSSALSTGSGWLSAAMGLCAGLGGIACIAATTLLLVACYLLIQRFCYGVCVSCALKRYLPVVPCAFIGLLCFLLLF